MTPHSRKRFIIFYDSDCKLCNYWVRRVLSADHEKKFLFSSLNGDLAEELLSKPDRINPQSVVLYADGAFYKKSEAAAQIYSALGGRYRFLGALISLIPRSIANSIYDWIAARRLSLFGREKGSGETCPIPRPEDQSRFIDSP